MKKILLSLIMLMTIVIITGCQQTKKAVENATQPINFWYNQSPSDIADNWVSMVTPSPGGGEGTVTKTGDVAVIHAAPDGWGGVQSPEVTLDLSKNPMLFVQVKESPDPFKWGAKFVPTTPLVEGHEWGVYLIEDNNFKWNNYAVSDITLKLGQDFIDVYGNKVKGVIWVYAAGGPDATVEISSVKILNQK